VDILLAREVHFPATKKTARKTAQCKKGGEM